MQTLYINGMSLLAPGLHEAKQITAILSGQQDWLHSPLPQFIPAMLPANERRRATTVSKLALQALHGLLHENEDLSRTQTVFASSDGDLSIVDNICHALTQPEKMVSPTQFHNSVHNAPAGYWAIAAAMQSASVSLSAGNESFSAGLLEAATQVSAEQCEVLYVAYDVAAPKPLDASRHFDEPVAVALRLSLQANIHTLAGINLSVTTGSEISGCRNASLDTLSRGNPAGAGLPLLEILHRKIPAVIFLPYVMGNQLQVEITPA